mgnify:CR=1 FL=1
MGKLTEKEAIIFEHFKEYVSNAQPNTQSSDLYCKKRFRADALYQELQELTSPLNSYNSIQLDGERWKNFKPNITQW